MKNKGFIGWLFLAFLALVLLKFFLNWDVFDAAASSQGQSTIGYARELINTIWSYVGKPLIFVWDRVLWPILRLAWDNFQTLIEKGREVDLSPVTIPPAP